MFSSAKPSVQHFPAETVPPSLGARRSMLMMSWSSARRVDAMKWSTQIFIAEVLLLAILLPIVAGTGGELASRIYNLLDVLSLLEEQSR